MAVASFAQVEGIGQELAEKLVHAGFLTVEGILAADAADLESIEGFDSDTASAVRAAVEAAQEAQGDDEEEEAGSVS